jgi:hypothetical protein
MPDFNIHANNHYNGNRAKSSRLANRLRDNLVDALGERDAPVFAPNSRHHSAAFGQLWL